MNGRQNREPNLRSLPFRNSLASIEKMEPGAAENSAPPANTYAAVLEPLSSSRSISLLLLGRYNNNINSG
jgi:hypothetical protein